MWFWSRKKRFGSRKRYFQQLSATILVEKNFSVDFVWFNWDLIYRPEIPKGEIRVCIVLFQFFQMELIKRLFLPEVNRWLTWATWATLLFWGLSVVYTNPETNITFKHQQPQHQQTEKDLCLFTSTFQTKLPSPDSELGTLACAEDNWWWWWWWLWWRWPTWWCSRAAAAERTPISCIALACNLEEPTDEWVRLFCILFFLFLHKKLYN